jgi:bifunctional UDP-N-acetylglucosamine pyrophosphorylase/glucosamine-1-phosphate N-acetyltransferase
MKSSKAKVLHEIGGKPMLHHIVGEAQKLSDDITVVVAHQAEKVISSINSKFSGVKFLYQDDNNYPGTGGSLREYQPKYERVLILNGDMPLAKADELRNLLLDGVDIVLSKIVMDNPTGYGRVIEVTGEVIKIVEEKDATLDEKSVKSVNAGVYFLKSEVLKNYLPKLSNNNKQREYYLTDIVQLAKDDDLTIKAVAVSEDSFSGINSKLQLSRAEEIYLQRIRERAMIDGVTIHLPHTVYIEESVQFIGECEVEANTTITGKSVIVNSTIKAGSVVEDSFIGDSTVGVMAHIRPDSYILNSKVGNFVEVKKSKLDGVKAGHLSYLGDSDIGENTNIGAGVITANYDGKHKHKTKIGRNVFVGSDSQLIAPVDIPDNVMIGAGTTLPSNTEIDEGSLTISRGNVRTIKNFFFKFFGKK